MDHRAIGTTGLRVSRIGLGCVTFGREIDQAASFAVADRAVERGINFFDTAEAYHRGESERVLGRYLRERGLRDRVVVATKAALPLTGPRILEAAEASLKNLQTDRIDLYYLHRCPEDPAFDECLGALHALVASGKVRAVACSNFDAPQLKRALDSQRTHGWSPMAATQPIYNLVSREIEAELLPLCARERVAAVTYSPLGAGFLTGKYRQGGEVPKGSRFDVIPGHQGVYFHDDKWSVMELLRERSLRVNVPMTHLAMAWVLQQPAITTVLVGARSPAQVDQAFEAMAVDASLVADIQ
ncbi:MAG: aldo/keto reductase [Planctomycetota bacterium]|nr:aldo/keto reductase [Planctomycetota bacterium]